jgi:formate/nitrite transporter FocA (FNT family)
MNEEPNRTHTTQIVDALLPAEMALACEIAGATKAARDALGLIVLGLLAGAFVALGALFMTVC